MLTSDTAVFRMARRVAYAWRRAVGPVLRETSACQVRIKKGVRSTSRTSPSAGRIQASRLWR